MNLQLRNVDFSYNRKKVFSNLSVDFSDDGLIAIAGNNGSGKSTLLKLLAGIIQPSCGQILINNTDYKKLGNKAISQMLSYVPQFLDTVFDLQVIDFLLMVSSNGNTSVNKNDFDRVYNALEHVGIQHFAQCNINELSGGERQKVLIANALAQDTQLILLDEPISHLDWSSQIEIFKLLREIATREKRKVIVIVHDINLISTYCDNTLLMKSGNIAAYGKTSEVLQPQIIQNVFGLNVHTVENYFIPSI